MKRWLVAIGSSIGLATGWGSVFIQSFGLFQKSIIAEMGWTRGEVAAGFSLATLVAAALVPLTGAWLDRKNVRPVVLLGIFLLTGALIGFSQVHSYPEYLAAAVLMGLVGATTSYPTYITILPRWFPNQLGVALAIASTGVGYGTAILTPYITNLILKYGWREALLILAATLLPLGLLNFLFLIKNHPGVGAVPAVENTEKKIAAETGMTFGEVVRRVDYWALILAFGAVVTVTVGINFQFSAMLVDRGASIQTAAFALSVTALSVVAARIVTGVIMDYVPPRIVGLVLFSAQAVGVLVLTTGVRGGAMLYVTAILLGLVNGGEGSLMPYVLSKKYGGRAYGRIYGTCFTFFNLGTLTGPLVMGMCFDHFGSYQPMFYVFVGVSLVSAIAVLLAGSVTARRKAMPIPDSSVSTV